MRIAINCRFAGYLQKEGYSRFIIGLVNEMQLQNPNDTFLCVYDNKKSVPFSTASNLTFKAIGPKARQPLAWKFWYDFSLPLVVKKWKADVLISPDGFCSLTTTIPQVLAIHDLAFLHYPQGIRAIYAAFYKLFTPKFIAKANHIVTVSEFSKADIVKHYPIAKDKISVVYNAADKGFSPIDDTTKDLLKQQITEGREYFLYVGAIHPRKNLINLLKGFSWFKKRYQSNMKLVLAGRMAWKNELFLKQLETYKYRNDVVITGYVEEEKLQEIVGAAYALVYPSCWEGFGLPVLEAMQSGVPTIIANNSSLPEIAGEAGFLVDPDNAEEWGQAMGILFKDENHRNQLIQNGLTRAKDFNWENSAQKLKSIIDEIVKTK
jgi:glycosyltransferase involved in cell wall biosynthesis